MYNANPDGYCGDEDNGQTSAWYVFSALGFYPVCPGSGEYVLGAPLFKNVRLNLENGKVVDISAPDNSDDNRFVGKMTVDGKTYDKNFLSHEDLTDGAVIVYDMTARPNENRGVSPESRPYSFSAREKK